MTTEHGRAVEAVIEGLQWGLECRSNSLGQTPFWHVFTKSPYDPETHVQIMSEDACQVLEETINEWGWVEVASPLVQSQIFFALLIERGYQAALEEREMLDYGPLLG